MQRRQLYTSTTSALSQSFSITSSPSILVPALRYCHCGLPAKVWQVRKDTENKGKFFRSCPHSRTDRSCNFFSWVRTYVRADMPPVSATVISSSRHRKRSRDGPDGAARAKVSGQDNLPSSKRTRVVNNGVKAIHNAESEVVGTPADMMQVENTSGTIEDSNITIASSQETDDIFVTDDDAIWFECMKADIREELQNGSSSGTTDDPADSISTVTVSPSSETSNDSTHKDEETETQPHKTEIRPPIAYKSWDDVPCFTTPQILDVVQNHIIHNNQLFAEMNDTINTSIRQRDHAQKDLKDAQMQVMMMGKEMERIKRECDVLRAEKSMLRYEIELLREENREYKNKTVEANVM